MSHIEHTVFMDQLLMACPPGCTFAKGEVQNTSYAYYGTSWKNRVIFQSLKSIYQEALSVYHAEVGKTVRVILSISEQECFPTEKKHQS